MLTSEVNVQELIRSFRIEGAILPYSSFVPRLYNFCRSLGFEPGRILPSRAFCSDENQGYPTILIAKHFGTFPFNHGRGGAIVATQRHAPFCEHGQDLLMIQASHVGYCPANGEFGIYRRIHAEHAEHTASCGKLANILSWYRAQYAFAQNNVLLERCGDTVCVRIDNGLLRGNRPEGLFLNLALLVARGRDTEFIPVRTYSTAKSFPASDALRRLAAARDLQEGERSPLGSALGPSMFVFKRELDPTPEGPHHQEFGLIKAMPWIVTASYPLLAAAQINTQIEFDRSFRTEAQSLCFQGKHLLHIAGLNIDISPLPGEVFPATHFVPWAAYIRDRDGNQRILEQDELLQVLLEQEAVNDAAVDLESAITAMAEGLNINV
jgi:hypothetical protein